jgi:hypothetical protein
MTPPTPRRWQLCGPAQHRDSTGKPTYHSVKREVACPALSNSRDAIEHFPGGVIARVDGDPAAVRKALFAAMVEES